MKIKLNNIGMTDTAVVDIDGITVIAGENNTVKVLLVKHCRSYTSHYRN